MNVRLNLLALLLVAVVGGLLRAWDLPARYEVRDSEELSCIQGSLELFEGIAPGHSYPQAGPLTWLGWSYATSLATRYTIKPTDEERAVPLAVRPLVAMNHALFEINRDASGIRQFIVLFSNVLSVLAVMAAFAVGARCSGLAGAILLGGLFAVAPLLINYAEQARSFSMAWSFLMIAIYFAVCHKGKTALWGSALLLGFSIAQRIDMVLLVPLVWLEFGYSLRQLHGAGGRPIYAIVRQTGIALVTSFLLAPWWSTNIFGNIRAISIQYFSVQQGGAVPWRTTLLELGWNQGLAIVALLFIAGSLWGIFRRTLGRPLLCIFVLLLLPMALKMPGHDFTRNAGAVLALFIAAPWALNAVGRSPRIVWTLVAVSLLLPLSMTLKMIRQQRKSYVPDNATAWIESHVPRGSLVLIKPGLHDPLPTPTCADVLWQEEMNNDAAMLKMKSALSQFHLRETEMPRAMSEENMYAERAERRGWYILGSRSWLPDRRFDIHIYGQSKIFGSTDPMPEFNHFGGVLVWRGGPIKELKAPLVKWVNADGVGTYIYCSDNLRVPKLN